MHTPFLTVGLSVSPARNEGDTLGIPASGPAAIASKLCSHRVFGRIQRLSTTRKNGGSGLAREGVGPDTDDQPALRNASTNSCLRIFERPGMFFARASFIRLSTVWTP